MWQTWVREAVDVLWPRSCAGCGAPATDLCSQCQEHLRPRHVMVTGLRVGCLGNYEGAVRDIVLACKEEGGKGLSRTLGFRLKPMLADAEVIAIVPPSRAGMRRRGFHALEWVAGALPVPAVSLRFAAPAAEQKVKARGERLTAARGIQAPAAIAGARVAVLDDVVTTGATMRAALQAVMAAGAHSAVPLALACTPRRTVATPECADGGGAHRGAS